MPSIRREKKTKKEAKQSNFCLNIQKLDIILYKRGCLKVSLLNKDTYTATSNHI